MGERKGRAGFFIVFMSFEEFKYDDRIVQKMFTMGNGVESV